jgi:DNA-binding LytR/AlgR family response regulator
MERIIIIDDKKCEKALADFLEANKEHIRFNTTMNNVKSSAKGFFEELTLEIGPDDKLAVKSNQQIEIVHTRDITHIEAIDQKTKLYFSNNTSIETSSNLDSFANRLKGSTFLRVHDNFIINLDFFSKLDIGESKTIELINAKKVPIDPAKKSLLLNFLNKIDLQNRLDITDKSFQNATFRAQAPD